MDGVASSKGYSNPNENAELIVISNFKKEKRKKVRTE